MMLGIFLYGLWRWFRQYNLDIVSKLLLNQQMLLSIVILYAIIPAHAHIVRFVDYKL